MGTQNQSIARLLAGKGMPMREKRKARSILFQRSKLTQPFRVPGTPFPVGQRQVFLPNFEIALMRDSKLPPNWATFHVPLNIHKLDLRDYLWHAYGLHARAIRVKVIQPEITTRERDVTRSRSWYQPRSLKRMTVEMDEPFYWPDETQDLSPWHQDREKRMKALQEERTSKPGSEVRSKGDEGALLLRRNLLAERLVEGQEKWKGERVSSESIAAKLSIDTTRVGLRRRV